jgi:hypothetical protein
MSVEKINILCNKGFLKKQPHLAKPNKKNTINRPLANKKVVSFFLMQMMAYELLFCEVT